MGHISSRPKLVRCARRVTLLLCVGLTTRTTQGTPFNTTLSEDDANAIRILSHNGNVLFQTPFDQTAWHNFAVLIDSDELTLQVFYSQDGCQLQAVSDVEDNSSVPKGPTGQGDFHFGVLKVRLAYAFRTCLLTRSRRAASVN